MDSDKSVTGTRPAWQRILLMFAAASLVVAALLLGPVIKHEMAAREADRIKRVHAEGLIPCGQFDGTALRADTELLAQLPAMPALSITANPAFNDIESVHLVGQDLYYVRRQRPAAEFPPKPIGSRTPKIVRVSTARLSGPVSSSLVELVESDIARAAAEWPMGLDGITYYFETPTGCATAWSPDSDTRADKMVDLFWSLAARARKDVPSKDKADDAELLKKIEALQSE